MASLGDGQLNSISVIYENASVYNSTDYLFQLKRVQLITLALAENPECSSPGCSYRFCQSCLHVRKHFVCTWNTMSDMKRLSSRERIEYFLENLIFLRIAMSIINRKLLSLSQLDAIKSTLGLDLNLTILLYYLNDRGLPVCLVKQIFYSYNYVCMYILSVTCW